MQAVGVLFSGALGGGVAAGGGGLAATLSTGLAIGGTVLSTISGIQAAQFQAAILDQQAAIELGNARRIRQAGSIEAQEADFAALAAIGAETARQGASGVSLNSPSFVRRRARNKVNASTNRLRIIDDAEVQASNATARASAASASASAKRGSIGFGVLSGLIGVGDDLISGASLINESKARRLNRTAVGVG